MPYDNFGEVVCALCGLSIKDGKLLDLTEDTSLVWCTDCNGYQRWKTED
jgi:hypothetical protein